ncbi:ganglioside GM2 activator-like [Saccostrea echinata]|uniref:ganglioside GM2 activator-like n=1 Tax=Saccostrea echinata TaxID=191078 RepID=UPI002A8060B2|nr:ganglioside GM2 activator-like [Saccostrea echinata]
MAGFLIVLLALVTGSLASHPFSYRDCNHSPNKIIHVTSAHLNPFPVVVPGDLTGDIVIQAPRLVQGNHYKLDVHIQKHALFWITVPCLSGVGSCSYDLCNLLSTFNATQCPPQLRAQNLPCHCPFQPGTYTMTPAVFKIPEMSGLWSWLASGDYRVDAKITDTQTGEEVACYHVEVSATQPPCSGFLCSIFG